MPMVIHPPNEQGPDSITRALAISTAASGYRLVTFRQRSQDRHLLLGAPARPYHRLDYAPFLEPHLDHLRLESAVTISRIYAQPPTARYVPDCRGRLPESLEDELTASGNAAGSPFQPLPLCRALREAITTIPTNLRVTRDLVAAYPQHTHGAEAYLRCVGDPTKEVEAACPSSSPSLDRIVGAMRDAYAIETARIFDHELLPARGSHAELGLELADGLYRDLPQGHTGDIASTEYWAQRLGIAGTFSWYRL